MPSSKKTEPCKPAKAWTFGRHDNSYNPIFEILGTVRAQRKVPKRRPVPTVFDYSLINSIPYLRMPKVPADLMADKQSQQNYLSNLSTLFTIRILPHFIRKFGIPLSRRYRAQYETKQLPNLETFQKRVMAQRRAEYKILKRRKRAVRKAKRLLSKSIYRGLYTVRKAWARLGSFVEKCIPPRLHQTPSALRPVQHNPQFTPLSLADILDLQIHRIFSAEPRGTRLRIIPKSVDPTIPIDAEYWQASRWADQSLDVEVVRFEQYRTLEQRKRWFKRKSLYRPQKFRKFFQRCLTQFRRIAKYKLFNRLFQGHFERFVGFTQQYLLEQWRLFRRAFDRPWQSGAAGDSATQFTRALSFRLQELSFQLGLASSLDQSQVIAAFNGLTLNGLPEAIAYKHDSYAKFRPQPFAFFKPGDILKVNPNILHRYSKHGHALRKTAQRTIADLALFIFLQVMLSMCHAGMTEWPKSYVFKYRTFRTPNWIRRSIRDFPNKSPNYLKRSKSTWKFYPRRVFSSKKVWHRRQRS